MEDEKQKEGELNPNVKQAVDNPPPSDTGGDNTPPSAYEEAKQAVIAEYQPKLANLESENSTLRDTIKQYKELLKGTHREDSGSNDVPKVYKIKHCQTNWHIRKD